MPKMRAEKGKHISNSDLPAARICISAGWGLLTDLVLLLIFALVLAFKGVPRGFLRPIVTVILTAGGITGGFLCGKALRRNGMLYGALVGTVQFLVLLPAGLAVQGGGFTVLGLYKWLLLLVGGAVGCVIGVNRKSRFRRAALKHSS